MPSSIPVQVYFDGMIAGGNPGGCACGGFVTRAHPEVPAMAGGEFFCEGADATNNVAEFMAATLALNRLSYTGYRGNVLLRGDSKLIVQLFQGRWRSTKPHLQRLTDHMRKAADAFSHVTVKWIPREQNADADKQSRLAYERHLAARKWRAQQGEGDTRKYALAKGRAWHEAMKPFNLGYWEAQRHHRQPDAFELSLGGLFATGDAERLYGSMPDTIS